MTTYVPLSLLDPSSGSLAFRNRIINGSCLVQQYPSNAVMTSNSGSLYGGVDRYKAYNNGATGGAFTQSASTFTYNSVTYDCVLQTVTTAATTLTGTNYFAGITQFIEAYNCYDLQGGTASLSFLFETALAGNYSVCLFTGASSWVTSFTAVAGVQQIQIPAISIPSNLGITPSNLVGLGASVGFLNLGTYQTSTLNSWQSGTYRTASSATNWAATSGNYIAVSQLQFEKGSSVTSFENRPYGVELALSQRYFVYLGGYTGNPAAIGYQVSGGSLLLDLALPQTMRTTPTTTLIGTWSVSNCGQPVLTATSIYGINLSATATSTGTMGYNATTTSGVTASAEL